MKRILAVLTAVITAFALVSCGNGASDQGASAGPEGSAASEPAPHAADTPAPAPESTLSPWEGECVSPEFTSLKTLGLEYGRDYVSLYDRFGGEVSVSEVREDENGLSYIERDGREYELGLDFLSKAMIRNASPCEGFDTEDEAYAEWWRLYIQRWNYLLPEVPIAVTEYDCLYNTRIGGVKETPVNPYFGVTQALPYWTSGKDDNSISIASSSEFGGCLRISNAVSDTYSADQRLMKLVCGLELVAETAEGAYVWNPAAVREHSEVLNDDGSRTFTITIRDDLRFSDGSPVTAADYLVKPLVSMTPVLREALENDALSPWDFVPAMGRFRDYRGERIGETDGVLDLVRLVSDHEFSVTIPKEYADDYYRLRWFCITPEPHEAWLGGARIEDSGEGCRITDEFYRMDGVEAEGVFAHADRLKSFLTDSSKEGFAAAPWSGPYVPVELFSESDPSGSFETGLTLTLVKNPYFKGNFEGVVPSAEKVFCKWVIDDLTFDRLEKGEIDVYENVTGDYGAHMEERLLNDPEGRFDSVRRSKPGYGKLSFRADLGPVQFASVRRAIAYCCDRESFCKSWAGGMSHPANAPINEDMWAYKRALEKGFKLDEYAYGVDEAIAELEKDGWIWNEKGEPYESGVRYKRIPLELMDEKDLNYTVEKLTTDPDGNTAVTGEYKVVAAGDYCYMPLALNCYLPPLGGGEDLIMDMLACDEGSAFEKAGFIISVTYGSFMQMMNELNQCVVYGFYGDSEIVPKYNLFLFNAGFGSPRYDYSEAFTVDPEYYGANSDYFLRDYADMYPIG